MLRGDWRSRSLWSWCRRTSEEECNRQVQVKTRARQSAVVQEGEPESKGMQGRLEQDKLFTDETRGT